MWNLCMCEPPPGAPTVLLTTRKREVCTSMQCQSIIELHLLTKEEALTLFKFHANITHESPFVSKGLATKIVDECKGLLIAIVTVGSTLKGKNLEGWNSALSRLQDSKPLAMPKGLRSPHACLQLSYDNLTDEIAKSFFLLCAIFPEDHEIDLEDLFRFGRGLGLTGTCQTIEKARREMHVAIDILMDSCLLLHAKNKKVKMHDMVRDVALWIASEKGQAILASAAMDLKMLVEDETIEDKKAISLWDLKNGQLPSNSQLYCPTLEILLLHSPIFGFEVPNVFHGRLKILKVMAFLTCDYNWYRYIERYPLSLSRSIASLEKLHTLCLRGYILGDISILERLQALEILDLRHSSFEEFPNGIAALKKLKLLDLYNCSIEKSNNVYEIIVKCLQLEELYLCVIPSKEKFPHNFSFSKLRRYVRIHIVYQNGTILDRHRPSRALCIDGFNAPSQSFISLPIKDLFLGAEYLHLENLEGGYKNVMLFMDQQSMNQLIVLILEKCPEIECLFDSTITINTNGDTEAPFSNLVILELRQMDSLQDVFHDPSSRCSLKSLERLEINDCIQLYRISFLMNSNLCNLKVLKIYYCPMLTSLFMPSVVQTLKLLEELYIVGCNELKHIVEEVKEGNVDYVTRQNHTSLRLPKLKEIYIGGCKRLEYILLMCYARRLVNLERLTILDCCELKYVFATEKEHQQSHHQTNIDISLVNFYRLRLDSLPELAYIWPEYCHPSLPNWKVLWCNQCPTMLNILLRQTMIDSYLQQDSTTMDKEILWLVVTTFNQLCDQIFSPKLKAVLKFRRIGLSDLGVKGLYQFQVGEHDSDRQLVPLNLDLEDVRLMNLPELNFIWKGPTNFLSLQQLEEIYVYGCPKLKTIFSSAILRSLPKLISVRISKCEDLEDIFDSGDEQEFKRQYTCSQQVCFPELLSIVVLKCNKLKFLFYNFVAGHFPSLFRLEIEECSQLEKVFAFEAEVGDDGQEWTSKDAEQPLMDELQFITLQSLPNFKEIHHRFKLKDHVKQSVNDCPKYSSSLYLYQDM